MRTFEDAKQRGWGVELDFSAADRIKATAGIDILEGSFSEMLMRLGDDMRLFARVMFALCQLQALDRGVTQEDFCQALRGGVWDEAMRAFLGECEDFFPHSRLKAYREAMKREAEIQAATTQIVNNEIDSLVTLAERGKLAGESPDSLGSTPAG